MSNKSQCFVGRLDNNDNYRIWQSLQLNFEQSKRIYKLHFFSLISNNDSRRVVQALNKKGSYINVLPPKAYGEKIVFF